MKKLSYILVSLACISLAFNSADISNYTVDVSNSTIEWAGNRVVGGGHTGTLNLKEGSLILENGILAGGKFVIDMNTINTTDLTGDRKQRLDNHLRDDSFFDVEKFPTSELIITKVESIGSGRFRLTGNLTIKNTTKSIEFPATVATVGNKVVASANLTFDRSEFDVRHGSGKFFENLGDRAISDDIPLTINLVAEQSR